MPYIISWQMWEKVGLDIGGCMLGNGVAYERRRIGLVLLRRPKLTIGFQAEAGL